MRTYSFPQHLTHNPEDLAHNYGLHPIIVSPNLGNPTFLQLKKENGDIPEFFEFSVNIISPFNFTGEKVKESLQNQVALYPLFDRDTKTNRLIRGSPVLLDIFYVAQTRYLSIESILLPELYQNGTDRRSYLLRHDFFGEVRTIFSAKLRFSITNHPKILQWLENHELLMFDLVQELPILEEFKVRINYHSLVIKKSKYDSLKFVQISDIHVAKRYDEFLGFMTQKIEKINDLRFDLQIRQRLQPHHNKEPNTDDELEYYNQGALIRRFKNPNNSLRRFIQWANDRVYHNDLDFVFITGDIIDYCLKENISYSEKLELNDTNWDVFLRILLNEPLEIRPDIFPFNILSTEEIAVPIYTLTGNHDVRLNGYSLSAVGMNKNFNLKSWEVKIYRDPTELKSLKSLIIDKYCLRAYYQFFNPFDDYFLRFGNSIFILLNSGADAFLSLKSLLMASPASVGFKDTQIRFAQNVAQRFMKEYDQNDENNNFLLSHAPVLNPTLRNPFIRKFKSLLGIKILAHPEFYKVSRLKKNDIKEKRADLKLDFNFGNISRHWIDTIALLYQYSMIGLHGHTHQTREFKIVLGLKNNVRILPNGKILDNPFWIYWDDYSQIESAENIQKEKPFDFQTPSLSIREETEPKKIGPFRLIHLKNNKLTEIQIKYLADLMVHSQH